MPRHPQLVVDGDWAQLFELKGVRKDARRLEELRTRITEQALTNAALEAQGVQTLLDRQGCEELTAATPSAHCLALPSTTLPIWVSPGRCRWLQSATFPVSAPA